MPMVPVPEAIETVLKETAKFLWFREHRASDDSSSTCTASNLIGRISAEDIKAPAPGYPDHNSSIMDGYAIKTDDLVSASDDYNSRNDGDQKDFVLDFVIVGKVYAGDEKVASSIETSCRTAIYITTGAVIPKGYDAVIPVEETTLLETSEGPNTIKIIPAKVQSILHTTPWTWIRTVGCDIPPESIVLSKGEIIQPVHLALLAQVGVNLQHVKVKELIRVGVLSTGNELIVDRQEKSAVDGKIPDVNRPLLLAQLSTYQNCEAVDLGIVTDDEGLDAISTKLKGMLWEQGNDCVDVVITTGGISMGEKDVMEQVFIDRMGGKIHFGR
jgi:molybdopterin biosynthesis enzyme